MPLTGRRTALYQAGESEYAPIPVSDLKQSSIRIRTNPDRRMSLGWRSDVLTVSLVFVFILIGWIAKGALLGSMAEPATTRVTVGDIEDSILATGTLKPVNLVAVGAQVSGRIVSLKITPGQKVRAGDLIAEIDSHTQENALRTNEAALQYVRAQRQEKEATLSNAEANLTRQRATLVQRASSQAEFDSAETTVKITRAQIAQLDAQLLEAEVAIETARVNLSYTRITAPVDGTVLAIVAQQGQTVNAVQSAPTIVVLGQTETMSVRAEISEADVVNVMPGQKVYFTILGDPERRYYTNIDSIEPAPESIKTDSSFSSSTTTSSTTSTASSSSSAIYYNAIFQAPNADGRLRTYMTAEVHIILGEARDVLIVPAAALGPGGTQNVREVKILGPDGVVTTRSVKIGLNNRINAQVLDGLKAGDRVVIGTPGSKETPKSIVPPPGAI